MQSFVPKQSKPVQIQAIQYVAPDGAGEAGNLDEIAAAGFTFKTQMPWNPAGGQHSIIVAISGGDGEKLATSGDYLCQMDDGRFFGVITEQQLRDLYDPAPTS